MTRARIAALTGALATAALAGCSSDEGRFREVTLLREAIGRIDKETQETPAITRAQVDGAGVPILLATVERRDATATLLPAGRNGPVVTWTTGDGTTLSLRGGVVIASRGLAPDLMSAAVPDVRALRDGAQVTRSHYTLSGDDQTLRADFLCTGRNDGPARIEIVEKIYATTRITELCSGAQGRFTNHYWVGLTGEIRQSRQWLGPDVGFLRLQRLDG